MKPSNTRAAKIAFGSVIVRWNGRAWSSSHSAVKMMEAEDGSYLVTFQGATLLKIGR